MSRQVLDIEPLFEWDETPPAPAPTVWVAVPTQCDHCGEWSANSSIHDSNHGTVWNGWCGKRLRATLRAYGHHLNRDIVGDELDWLATNGFPLTHPHR